ncbi:hypothetical protein BGZ95_007756 [Linnemannia exigua]|uniref:polynucleotide adenylyltransferase n=1 Tax=Linnemannia exigua TaxID=604196 RepID=A0AAD4DGJ0_9FUNG|nr:hypothetical protein BGZ95_007756 [Linnemannia exigua]
MDQTSYRTISRYLKKLKLQAATAEDKRNVETLRQDLEATLRRCPGFHNAEVHLFGSFESGLSTTTSDADFTVYNFVSSGIEKPIHVLARILRTAGYGPITTISHARVPIVSFVEQDIHCDISINQHMGVFNSQLINTYQTIDTRFLGLWFGIRHLARQHGILGGSTGYLSSYALTMMLIVFLQDVTSPPILPRLQQQRADKMLSCLIDEYHCAYDRNPRDYTSLANKNNKSEGELLADFCKYYGYKFSYSTQEVNPCLGVIRSWSVSPPPRSRTDMRPKDWAMCILDPFIPKRNVAGNCRAKQVSDIQMCFRSASAALELCDIDRAFKR